jgi:DNA-binding MarR family transcriptional regulator
MLGLLQSVERREAPSQRNLANELGVAVGLVNAYLKRCINKGLLKVKQAPAGRYAYYLTPHGFTEKSRLTIEYLAHSFTLFRQAKKDFTAVLSSARMRGVTQIAIYGASDLAEIAFICALDSGLVVKAVVDHNSELSQFLGIPLRARLDGLSDEVDAILVAEINATREAVELATAMFGPERVFVPEMLGIHHRLQKFAS